MLETPVLTLPGTLPADTPGGADKLAQHLLPGNHRRRQPAIDQFADIFRDFTMRLAMGLSNHVAHRLFSETFRCGVGFAPDPVVVNWTRAGLLVQFLLYPLAALSTLTLVKVTDPLTFQGAKIEIIFQKPGVLFRGLPRLQSERNRLRCLKRHIVYRGVDRQVGCNIPGQMMMTASAHGMQVQQVLDNMFQQRLLLKRV